MLILCGSGITGIASETCTLLSKVGGIFHSLSVPLVEEKLQFDPMQLILSGITTSTYIIGNHKDCRFHQLSSRKDYKIMNEKIPLFQSGGFQDLKRCQKNDVRFRLVLTEHNTAFDV